MAGFAAGWESRFRILTELGGKCYTFRRTSYIIRRLRDGEGRKFPEPGKADHGDRTKMDGKRLAGRA